MIDYEIWIDKDGLRNAMQNFANYIGAPHGTILPHAGLVYQIRKPIRASIEWLDYIYFPDGPERWNVLIELYRSK